MLLDKLLDESSASIFVKNKNRLGESVVVTNGCFDILHVGHVTYLEAAASLGDHLIVAVNSDQSVSSLKGPSRPINPLDARMKVLAALESVSAVVPFEEIRATRILSILKPDIYAKGGDYSLDQLDVSEVAAVQDGGGTIRILPAVDGFSTTSLLAKSQQ